MPAKVASPVVPAVPSNSEPLLTAAELAAYLNVPRSYITEKTRYRTMNPIPALRLGARTVRFRLSDVKVWLESRKSVLTKPRRYKRMNKGGAK